MDIHGGYFIVAKVDNYNFLVLMLIKPDRSG